MSSIHGGHAGPSEAGQLAVLDWAWQPVSPFTLEDPSTVSPASAARATALSDLRHTSTMQNNVSSPKFANFVDKLCCAVGQ